MKFEKDGDIPYQLGVILNNGINFPEHFETAILEITFAAADTAQEIRHSLGHVPMGFLVIYKDTESIIWGSALTLWTEEVLYLLCNVENTTIRLLVL